jgi:spore coat protein H
MARTLFALLVLAAIAPAADPSADLFKPTGPVPKFEITVDKAGRDSLRREPRKYVPCTLKVGDKTWSNVAIHLKGAAGSFRQWDDRPALTLNMDKLTKGQEFMGLDKFHLNNSVQDGSYMNEILCGEMALAMGLPAARGTHALVELNGRKVGFYVLKEGFDKTFLKRHFKDDNGNLYDGGFLQDVDAPLQLDSGVPNGHKDLRALAEACRIGDANKRFEALDKLVDVDKLVTMAALAVIATDWDGYPRNRNNYRVYFDPKGKAVFIPHGMDQMFQNPGEGVWHGWGGMVARGVLETPEGKKRYIAKLKEMTEKVFVLDKLYKRIDEFVPRGKEALVTVDRNWANNWENEVKNYKQRLKERSEVLKREIPKLK